MFARKKLVTSVILVAVLLVATAPMAYGQELIELRFMSWLDTTMLPKYEKFANEYMQARYPNVRVVGETTAGTNEAYLSKLLVRAAAGVGPDIFFLTLSEFDPTFIDNSLALDITDRLDADSEFKHDLPPTLVDAWSYQGRLYGVPTTIGQYAMYYNRHHFADVGLDKPSHDWTIRGEFAEIVRRLAVRDSEGNTTRYAIQIQHGLSGRFMNYVMSEGGHVVDEDVTRARINEPVFIDTLTFFKGLYDAGYVDRGSFGNAYQKFISENASMFMSGIFYQSRVAENAGFDWGIAHVPAGAAGRHHIANTNAWVINPASEHIDLAWELAKAFSSPEFARYALAEGLELPVSLSVLRTDFLATQPANLTPEERLIWMEAIDFIRPYPKSHLMPDIWNIAQQQVNQVWNGQSAPGPALEMAAELINAKIAEAKGN